MRLVFLLLQMRLRLAFWSKGMLLLRMSRVANAPLALMEGPTT